VITTLVIENFQSIELATLNLGRFTVITGPTGAGKSAGIRAFHLGAFNHRGTAFIRQGAKTCKVAFGSQDEGWVIGIERGGRGKDAYRISTMNLDADSGPLAAHVTAFTKLGGEAPAEILALHGLSELNFAGQFDHPYLLDASGGEAARTLGRLTNVALVFRAAALANQRRQQAMGDLRRAEAEVTRSTEQLQAYAALPAQSVAVAEAEEAVSRALSVQRRRDRLHALSTAAGSAEQAVGRAEEAARAAEPPSLEHLTALEQRRGRLALLMREHTEAVTRSQQWLSAGAAAVRDEAAAHQAIHDCLTESGTCPTCGLPVPR
jgi:hypothetical protein